VSVPRANSYNLAPVLDVHRGRGEPCPLPGQPERIAELGAGAPERALMLRFKDRMRLFRTTTRDFTSEEIARTKRAGQLYMDVSTKAFPDDFSADLRKLGLSEECVSCPERKGCPGCWVARSEDVFTKDDARARSILRRMAGDVLDVGAGLAPYAAELEVAVRAGTCRYFALDPDVERLTVLRSRHPWARTRRGTLDELCRESRRFRHVILLRSYNHLPDREAAAPQLASLVEPGGTLLVVDDVAFGLVRNSEQIRRAEGGPAVFEHFANDSAEQAHAKFAELALTLLERRDVEASGSNQWLLHYRKAESA
jgi:SAM-dependent methyltransferase